MNAMSDTEIRELIKLFKQSPQLYNNTYPDNRIMVKREDDETYSQICHQMNKLNPQITTDDVRYYLKVIKTRYKEEYDKVMQARDNGQEYTPTLRFYESLSFLTEQRDIKPEPFNYASLTRPTSSSQCANDNVYSETLFNSIKPEPYNYASVTKPEPEVKPTTSSQCTTENVYSETLFNSVETRPFYKTVLQRSMSSLQLATSIVDKCNEPLCLVFGHFIASELNRIQDPEIRSQAQWEIQEALKRASQEDFDNYIMSRRMYN